MNRQINIWPNGLKKQKYGKGKELTKADKLWRIKTFEEIRNTGGTLRDVAIKWGLSPNNGRAELMIDWYKEELNL